jgi:tungstate transport system permease protein
LALALALGAVLMLIAITVNALVMSLRATASRPAYA